MRQNNNTMENFIHYLNTVSSEYKDKKPEFYKVINALNEMKVFRKNDTVYEENLDIINNITTGGFVNEVIVKNVSELHGVNSNSISTILKDGQFFSPLSGTSNYLSPEARKEILYRQELMDDNDFPGLIVGMKHGQIDVSQIAVHIKPEILYFGSRDTAYLFESYLNDFFSKTKNQSVLSDALWCSRQFPISFVMVKTAPCNHRKQNNKTLGYTPDKKIELLNIPPHKLWWDSGALKFDHCNYVSYGDVFSWEYVVNEVNNYTNSPAVQVIDKGTFKQIEKLAMSITSNTYANPVYSEDLFNHHKVYKNRTYKYNINKHAVLDYMYVKEYDKKSKKTNIYLYIILFEKIVLCKVLLPISKFPFASLKEYSVTDAFYGKSSLMKAYNTLLAISELNYQINRVRAQIINEQYWHRQNTSGNYIPNVSQDTEEKLENALSDISKTRVITGLDGEDLRSINPGLTEKLQVLQHEWNRLIDTLFMITAINKAALIQSFGSARDTSAIQGIQQYSSPSDNKSIEEFVYFIERVCAIVIDTFINEILIPNEEVQLFISSNDFDNENNVNGFIPVTFSTKKKKGIILDNSLVGSNIVDEAQELFDNFTVSTTLLLRNKQETEKQNLQTILAMLTQYAAGNQDMLATFQKFYFRNCDLPDKYQLLKDLKNNTKEKKLEFLWNCINIYNDLQTITIFGNVDETIAGRYQSVVGNPASMIDFIYQENIQRQMLAQQGQLTQLQQDIMMIKATQDEQQELLDNYDEFGLEGLKGLNNKEDMTGGNDTK